MNKLFSNIYKNKTVLVTGHTGFKGSWLTYWLKQMGANVIGYSLDAPTQPNHFQLLDLDIISLIGDIRNEELLNKTFTTYQPDIVFHLAAQALVISSYENPIETYETNVIGTLKVFEACKKCSSVKAIVNITSDKAYENKESLWGYREDDPMGGFDPYSSSKGCSELLTASYRNSYFNLSDFGSKHHTLLASCRAGNVIGGGDWAKDRLVTDIMLSVSQNKKVLIRNPFATRPWQHVLEPLSGYLLVGQKLLEKESSLAGSWNFGPPEGQNITVAEVIKNVQKYWPAISYSLDKDEKLHEAQFLKLDCTKAQVKLNWRSVWHSDKTFEHTVKWYKAFYENQTVLTSTDFSDYINDARNKGVEWVS
jgi:CDP-glucose 4,6-dehydratase